MIAYKSAGAGVATEASGGALSPLCPATVDANDILIAHCGYEGTATTPSTPSGWTLLGGPFVIETTSGRHWIFGKIAAGTEDSQAVAFGSPAVTTMRTARVYSFSGYVGGTITQLVLGFSHISHATDPQMPTVTTTIAGGRAMALIFQLDDNPIGDPTGESGGNWTEAVAEYAQSATTPDSVLAIFSCIPTADPGTVTGGSIATLNDPCGTIGFEIRPSIPSQTSSVKPGPIVAAAPQVGRTPGSITRTITSASVVASAPGVVASVVGDQTAAVGTAAIVLGAPRGQPVPGSVTRAVTTGGLVVAAPAVSATITSAPQTATVMAASVVVTSPVARPLPGQVTRSTISAPIVVSAPHASGMTTRQTVAVPAASGVMVAPAVSATTPGPDQAVSVATAVLLVTAPSVTGTIAPTPTPPEPGSGSSYAPSGIRPYERRRRQAGTFAHAAPDGVIIHVSSGLALATGGADATGTVRPLGVYIATAIAYGDPSVTLGDVETLDLGIGSVMVEVGGEDQIDEILWILDAMGVL